ncbi:oocyte zinc finger protein XlCOF26-like [Xyrauchen texanus]|uniref:oocyte zinc finger protein XlCOF26-like n=1 Tax=Xyrauchen texanus TaxID=154827 RepID=UPI002241C97B|nr:oocyte zinc finger protein XlCOF26-like [Xyrauchen texanus]
MVLKEESQKLNEEEEKHQYQIPDDVITGEQTLSCSKTEETKSKKSFTCPQCGKSFTCKQYLNCHLRIHTEVNSFTCYQCGNHCIEKGGLEKYIIIHTGEKRSICYQCGKSFKHTNILQYQTAVNIRNKSFTCHQCGKRCKGIGGLERHMRTHPGVKRFVCFHCGKSFELKKQRDSHLEVHIKKKSVTCHQCGKSLSRKPCLDKVERITKAMPEHQKRVLISSTLCRVQKSSERKDPRNSNHHPISHPASMIFNRIPKHQRNRQRLSTDPAKEPKQFDAMQLTQI